MILGLPFREVWVLDTEFASVPGARPVPVCLVARELGSGRLVRLWQDQLTGAPPFDPTARDVLFVAFYAAAEWSVFLVLGWPLPARILDLYAEFRNATNGVALPDGRGLLSALRHFGIAAGTAEHKDAMRHLVMTGGPWSRAERREILDYCQADVDPLGALLERMLPGITATRQGLGQALLRGRYTAAVARMEHAGVPVDVPLLATVRARWDDIRGKLIAAVDADYGLYEGTTFKSGRFAAWLADRSIAWPRTETGLLLLDSDTFRDMSRAHPELVPLKELRSSLSELRLADLAVGPDGRNRVMLSPFATKTGRNAPSASRYVFGPAVWIRGLIRPAEGQAVAYIDWSSQEVWIAAALSQDPALLDSVQTGDPYLAFAARAGLVPAGATKDSHGAIRDACKTVVLGVNYGMQAQTLAARLGCGPVEAQSLLDRLARIYPRYTEWVQDQVDHASLRGLYSTVFGWTLRVGEGTRPTSLRNWPMQANGAEMLRLACSLATERGVEVCAPVHDALLIAAPAARVDAAVRATQGAMTEASRVVLDGLAVPTDVRVVRWPDRFSDPRGQVMWDWVLAFL